VLVCGGVRGVRHRQLPEGVSDRHPRPEDGPGGGARGGGRARRPLRLGATGAAPMPPRSSSTAASRASSSSRPAAGRRSPRMLAGDLYSPYTWQVRHFAEFETNETLIRFTPAGKPFGFVERSRRRPRGRPSTPAAARAIAEAAATNDWGIDLGSFRAGRGRAGGAAFGPRRSHLRLRAAVADGRRRRAATGCGWCSPAIAFTELTNFVKVPEAFERRYEEMRSANNGIATGAAVAAAVLYVIGGCVIGLFLLLRKRWVLWKAGPVVGALHRRAAGAERAQSVAAGVDGLRHRDLRDQLRARADSPGAAAVLRNGDPADGVPSWQLRA